MTEPDTVQMQRLVEADRPAPTAPDVPALLAAGHRRLRRRRIGAGAASLAVAAAVGLSAYAVGGGLADDGDGPTAVADVPPADGPRCGAIACLDPGARAEREQVVGGPWVVGELAGGAGEVLYTVRTDGMDLATGDPAEVEVLTVGYELDGVLHPSARTVQPGHDGRSPAGRTVSMWANAGPVGGPADTVVVVGYVEGAPEEITWSTPDGQSGTVDGTDGSLVPGHTVFFATLPLPPGHEQPTYEKRGGSYRVSPGDPFPPDVTFHTSDGWSCSLADCGSIG